MMVHQKAGRKPDGPDIRDNFVDNFYQFFWGTINAIKIKLSEKAAFK